MLHIDNLRFDQLAIHKVGNKKQSEALQLSNSLFSIDDELKEILTHYFLKPFKHEEYFHFTHGNDVKFNEVCSYAKSIFSDQNQLYHQSKELAKHLYNSSTHPNIKGGEFYVVYFRDCILDGEEVDAIGLFKSENKDTFLKVKSRDETFAIESQQGININKLDKGCLIFNTEEENGYVVSVVDNTNKQIEAQYWIDDFLQVQQREDHYFHTEGRLNMYKQFVTDQLPQEFETNKVDQADLLNRTIHYFKENEEFKEDHFQKEVFQQPEVIESVDQYKQQYERERQQQFADEFDISHSAVKRKNRVFKSKIKLDKNFHIYVHGDRSKIERGEDAQGKYYKIYFDQEY